MFIVERSEAKRLTSNEEKKARSETERGAERNEVSDEQSGTKWSALREIRSNWSAARRMSAPCEPLNRPFAISKQNPQKRGKRKISKKRKSMNGERNT